LQELITKNGKEIIVHADPYFISDMDESVYPHYYGFVNEVGAWYILKENLDGTIRIARASFSALGRYSDNWSKRTKLSYDYWYATF